MQGLQTPANFTDYLIVFLLFNNMTAANTTTPKVVFSPVIKKGKPTACATAAFLFLGGKPGNYT